MGLFDRSRDIYVDYDPDSTNEDDLAELRAELHETFREAPEFVIGKRRLGIITTAMLVMKIIKGKIQWIIEDKRKETSPQRLARLKAEIEELEQRLEIE